MIRVVLAAILAVALVAVAAPAIESAGEARSETAVRAEVATIDRAATELLGSNEPPPVRERGARRIVAVSFPDRSPTAAAVERVALEPAAEGTIARFRVRGAEERTVHLDAPIVSPDGDPVALGGSGEIDLLLTLETDGSGEPIVVVRRR